MRYKDFEEIAQSLEIKRNDIIMLHSDLSNFFQVEIGEVNAKFFITILLSILK